VETFIASGNVIFESAENARELEGRIEERLLAVLGYEVATFLRTPEEVASAAACTPWSREEMESAGALVIGFLKEPLPTPARARLAELETETDRLETRGREIYWRCATRQSDSKLSGAALERALGVSTTLRGRRTLERLSAKHPPVGPASGEGAAGDGV
jgi:uncharacterized protein (DUF1697 family)